MLRPPQATSQLQPIPENKWAIESDDVRWKAVVARDSTKDGTFVFAVRSTGIYCRPSCPSRHPHAEHVLFFARSEDAERSGFRACKRCHPDESGNANVELVQRLCKFIDRNLAKKLTLKSLSRGESISPYHLQRTFTSVLGISPREYIEARRLEKVRASLRQGDTVNNAHYEAGFTSRGRLYEKGSSQLGVNPGTFRRGGEGLSIHYTIIDSPIGRLLLGATDKGLCAVCIGASDDAVEASLREDYRAADLYRNDREMKNWAEEFSRYFEGRELPRDLPIDIRATAFQWRVWKHIQAIPFGRTSTYSEIAESMGNPQAVRAVANACASNPIALLIPCHRVVGMRGDLRGYRWGVKRKQSLLSLERSDKNTPK